MTPFEQARYLTSMKEQGYYSLRPIGIHHWVGLFDFMFTTAIIVGEMGDSMNVHDRWCYHSRADAQKALDAWDALWEGGTSEPAGWHRHPMSGRRRNIHGEETVEP